MTEDRERLVGVLEVLDFLGCKLHLQCTYRHANIVSRTRLEMQRHGEKSGKTDRSPRRPSNFSTLVVPTIGAVTSSNVSE